MTQVLSLATRDMETVGAPIHHHHMSLEKPFSRSRAGFDLASDGRHSPSPYRAGAGRKRASTINTAADANHGMFEPLSIDTSGQVTQDGSRDFICLCTPAPKIPRPRNAFILYRQHHQSQVTVENPKLSNPEISKIIGDKWKHESEDIKENWKKLAEEEKQRHQHQYPNYRYQPRRGTKTQGNWTSTSPSDEHGRCPKCHGRSISTPRTPSTPFSTSPASSFFLASQTQPSLRRLETPASSRRSSFEQSPTSTMSFGHQLPPVRDFEHHGGELTASPELKRRRANGIGGYHAVTGTPGAYTIRPPQELRRSPPEALTTTNVVTNSMMRPYAGTTTLPELAKFPRSQSGPMPPPLRPPGSSSWVIDTEPSSGRRHSGFDESLRLPPLQTTIPPPSPSKSPALEGRHVGIFSTRLNVSPIRDQLSRKTSDTTTALQQPTLNQKMSILSTISQPLPTAGRHGLRGDKRGAFIAVEGPSSTTLDQVGCALRKILVAGGDVALEVWQNNAPCVSEEWPKEGDNADDRKMSALSHAVDDDLLSSYFNIILSWRRKLKHITYHITGGRNEINSQQRGNDAKGSKVIQASSTEACTPPHDDRSPNGAPKLPVALVISGLSLTFSDAFASAMSISDSYSPVDHWRWTASLWRGTPSPDLVIYVPNDDIAVDGKEPGTVEVLRPGLMIVKIPTGRDLDEAMERRLAFEVMEWMRDAPFQCEVAKDWETNS